MSGSRNCRRYLMAHVAEVLRMRSDTFIGIPFNSTQGEASGRCALRDSEEFVALLSNLYGVDAIYGEIEDEFVNGRVRHRADIGVDHGTGIVLRDRSRLAAFLRSP
jgi:hypothetical protein